MFNRVLNTFLYVFFYFLLVYVDCLCFASSLTLDIAPLSVLFCNCLLFCNYPLADLTGNHMFGLGDLCNDLSFYSGHFKIFKNTLGQFIQNCLPKHVITSTNLLKSAEKQLTDIQQKLIVLKTIKYSEQPLY